VAEPLIGRVIEPLPDALYRVELDDGHRVLCHAQIGVLLSFETPSAGMRSEAASAGFYASPWGSSHARLQLLTVGELLERA
jgi:hypothetical protein